MPKTLTLDHAFFAVIDEITVVEEADRGIDVVDWIERIGVLETIREKNDSCVPVVTVLVNFALTGNLEAVIVCESDEGKSSENGPLPIR